MKKNPALIIFVILVVLVGGYSIYDYKYAKVEDQNEKNKVKVFSFDANDVVALKAQGVDSAPLLLTKKQDQWVVSGAVEDRADVQQVSSFISALVDEKTKVVKKEGEIQWKDYQLDQPGYSIELENSKGQKESVSISSLQAFDGNYFIKFGSQLVVGEKTWGQYMHRTADSFRDKKVFRDPFDPTTINITYDEKDLKQKFQIQKKDAAWEIIGKDIKLYDSQKIDQLVESVKTLRANEFLTDAKVERIASRVELSGSDNKSWWIEFGPEQKGTVYARSSSIQGVIQLTPGLIEKIKVPLDSLRNGKLPFQFDLEKVQRVKISTDLAKIDVKKTDLNWELTKPDEKKEVDQNQLVQLIQKLQNLEAKKFLAQAPANTKYSKSVQLTDKDEKELLLIRWGDEFSDKVSGARLVYVRSSKSPETLVLSASDLMALPVQTLVKDKAPVAQTPEPKQDEKSEGGKQ